MGIILGVDTMLDLVLLGNDNNDGESVIPKAEVRHIRELNDHESCLCCGSAWLWRCRLSTRPSHNTHTAVGVVWYEAMRRHVPLTLLLPFGADDDATACLYLVTRSNFTDNTVCGARVMAPIDFRTCLMRYVVAATSGLVLNDANAYTQEDMHEESTVTAGRDRHR